MAGMTFAPKSARGAAVAPLIDHTLLKPDLREADVVRLCAEARFYGFASVCVPPCRIALARRELIGFPVKAGTVVGFPMGFATAAAKAAEAADAVQNGADELDMVLCVTALKDGDAGHVRKDIRGVVAAAAGRTVKVILETCLLTDEEKVRACRLAVEAGAGFVKTSTGLAGGGATVEDVRLMRRTVGAACGVKASGGIRTLAVALALIEAGATRLGTSSGVAIVTEQTL